ncbi:MAG TPA: histidine phosphatase family protein, partial [Myxococcota bacterium]|nr:histidine phosphatase family protein [Myxococcota bacterium]
MRPLTDAGRAQAQQLAAALRDTGAQRLVSSPALRCRQTLAPLALATGLPVEIDDRLEERRDPAKACEALAGLRGAVVLCSHGDQIAGLLEHLRGEGAELADEPRCEKGSVWSFERRGAGPWKARYAPPPPTGPESDAGGTTVRVAVLDLGSTSFHLLVADAAPDGTIQRVLREREMLRLGALIAGAGGARVPEEVCERAVATARQLGATARRAGADLLLPIATAAIREATNGPDLAERIGTAIGVPTRVISGIEEARLTYSAFRRRLEVGSRLALGLDLGGGSLQLITGDDRDLRWETSLPLGTTRLHAELVASDPMARDERRAIRARVRERLADYREAIERWTPQPTIAAGGSVRALARLAAADDGRDPEAALCGSFLDAERISALARRLARSSQEERLRMPGMGRRRADLVATGAVILDTVVDALRLRGLTVSDWGLREGVILEAFEP